MYYFYSNAGSLPPVYQRSLLVLSTAMMMFAAKLYHVADTNNLLNLLFETDVSIRFLCFQFMIFDIVLIYLVLKFLFDAYDIGGSISWHQ